MENKVNHIQTIISINLFHKRWGKWNSKNKAESRKMGGCNRFQFFLVGWISFALSQKATYPLTLNHLRIINMEIGTLRQINRYLKKRNIESKVACPPQLYDHVYSYPY